MKITATHIGDINSLKLADPRTDESCKVYFERKGHFIAAGKVYNGSYLVYNSPTLEKSYAGVFVAEDINEEDAAIALVTLVAIDPVRVRVVNRTRYRARIAERTVEEKFRTGK
jgi:hypothetical protein